MSAAIRIKAVRTQASQQLERERAERRAREADIAASAKRAEDAARDMLMLTRGHELAPKVRTWASTQPLDVVKALFDSKVTASSKGRGGLQGAELAELRQKLGTTDMHKPEKQKEPHRNAAGDLVLPCIPPREAAKRWGGGK